MASPTPTQELSNAPLTTPSRRHARRGQCRHTDGLCTSQGRCPRQARADYIAAFNKGDAKVVAALYTEGSIRVTQALSADIQVSEGTYAVADLGEAQQVMWLSPHEALGHASPSALVTPSPATSRIRAFQPPSMTAPIAVMIHAPNRDTVAHVE